MTAPSLGVRNYRSSSIQLFSILGGRTDSTCIKTCILSAQTPSGGRQTQTFRVILFDPVWASRLRGARALSPRPGSLALLVLR